MNGKADDKPPTESTPAYARTSRPIEPHEIAESQRNWDARERKKREDEIRAPVEKKLAEAEKCLAAVRVVVDRVMGGDDATNGETRLAELLDGIVPGRKPSAISRQPSAPDPDPDPFRAETQDLRPDTLRGETRVEAIGSTLGAINSDDWALSRVAELRAQGERATFRIDWRKRVDGPKVYSVTVRRADGTIERQPRPSEEREERPPSLAFGTYDPPTYQGPTTYTDEDVFAGVGSSPKSEARSLKPEVVSEANSPWTGCGECDPLFPCHEGRAHCLRLEPMDPWSSLNDAIDLIVDLGGVIDEGIEGRIFGKMQVAMRHLSVRSRRWLAEQAEAKKQRQGAANPVSPRKKNVTYDGGHSHVVAVEEEPEVHPWDRPPTADSKDWKIWTNCLQAPRGDVLFRADLQKLLGTIGLSLVTELQHGADQAQLLDSFSMEDLRAEIKQRTIAHLTTDARAGGASCNHQVADAGLTLTPCPSCRQAWCRTGGGKYWVRCQCSTIRQVSGSSIVQIVHAWNEVVDAIASSSEKRS